MTVIKLRRENEINFIRAALPIALRILAEQKKEANQNEKH